MTASQPQSRFPFGICATLVLVVLVVFGQTLRHGFVDYDDGIYFLANPNVQAGLTWHGVAWAFQTCYADNWHPLTWLSLMLDVTVFGPAPMGHHLVNTLLHAANTLLLFGWLGKLTGARWKSAFVAALFALHPLHVESVAWASERKDLLSGFFFMLTLILYGRYAEACKARASSWKISYALMLICFALGLASKPMLVTLPFVLLLLDFWPLNRLTAGASATTLRRLIVEKIPFLLLSLASSAITLVAQKKAVQPLEHITVGIRVLNATVSYVTYLYKMVWPVDLAIPYPHRGYPGIGHFCVAAALLVVVSFCVVRFRRKYPFLLAGWLWYLGMLVPVIGLVQVGTQAMADRYTYLPLIGIFIALAWASEELFKRLNLSPAVAAGLAALLLGACALRTTDQLCYWRNSETLFSHAAAVVKDNDIAWYNLGEYYAGAGQLDLAADNYLKAIQIRPGYDDALNNLGVVLAQEGKLDDAVASVQESIRYNPNKADAHFNVGNIFILQHKLDDAVRAYNEALRLKPNYPEAHNNLANVLYLQGHLPEAIEHYQETLRLNPNHEGAKKRLRALDALPAQ